MLSQAEIPYQPDSAALFERLRDRRWAVFFDSGPQGVSGGRYDVLTADPMLTIVTRGHMSEVRGPGQTVLSPEDPFDLVRAALDTSGGESCPLPFCGGAIGYFSYDLARRLEPLPAVAKDNRDVPDMAIGIYDWAIVVDHRLRRTWLLSQNRDPATRREWRSLTNLFSGRNRYTGARSGEFALLGPVQSNTTREEYMERFGRIHRYIRNGDCYQVNFAQSFAAVVEGDPWIAYRQLRTLSPAPFSAFLDVSNVQVLSNSPERFLRVRNGRVETEPIKGTRPRGINPMHDLALADELRTSVKDQAENLMIVDLLRNDLGKSCRLGTIEVPKLFELRSFANVHHLVSTVTGELRRDRDALALLRGCFPGGSITGAPKIRAMEIIEELEPDRRGVYCGAIGYIGFDGTMDTNISIRTLIHKSGQIRFYAGGGIVADSEAEAEYKECFDKATIMFELLKRAEVGRVGS